LAHGHISRDTFPLPITGSLLRAQSKELHFGRGFFVLHGLRVDSYSREENIIIYAGVSTYVGDVRGRQQDQRHTNGTSLVLSHIKDLSNTTEKGSIGAPSNTNDKQVFHTDSGDIVSLFCLNPAASGGESKISSSWNVYNILAKERPDLIHTLSEDWVVDGYVFLISLSAKSLTAPASTTQTTRIQSDHSCITRKQQHQRQSAYLYNTPAGTLPASWHSQDRRTFLRSQKPKQKP
jgi:hypothetical protein